MEETKKRGFQVEFGKEWIESLTDGIIAFGMTLLMLGVGFPISVQTISKMSVE